MLDAKDFLAMREECHERMVSAQWARIELEIMLEQHQQAISILSYEAFSGPKYAPSEFEIDWTDSENDGLFEENIKRLKTMGYDVIIKNVPRIRSSGSEEHEFIVIAGRAKEEKEVEQE